MQDGKKNDQSTQGWIQKLHEEQDEEERRRQRNAEYHTEKVKLAEQEAAEIKKYEDELARLREDQDRWELERKLKEDHEKWERVKREAADRERLARDDAERFSVEDRERRHQRELLLAKMKAIDEGKMSTDNGVFITSSYSNSPPPTNGLQTASKYQTKSYADTSFGEYKPTFIATNDATINRKKKNSFDSKSDSSKKSSLMNELFAGANEAGSSEDEENIPVIFDRKQSHRGGASSPVMLFGGESREVKHVENGNDGSHLLPKRSRQPVTTFTGNTLNAIGDSDDDIEEVVI